jgi:hypothetical protein
MNSNGVHNCNWTLAGADGAVTGVVVSEDWPPSTFFPCEGCSSRMFLSGTGIHLCIIAWVPASARTTKNASFPPPSVIPTKVGIQSWFDVWVPASARTTKRRHSHEGGNPVLPRRMGPRIREDDGTHQSVIERQAGRQ